ncbi:uncharacterized protein LOC115776718 [Archocentrus centrarchus]|uniref:uncharacterized protein LOC115776718 n=1 Tax=Archocentrus centrarchus TaxID=63155 RepID=UPI0011EA034A|nr:uncharacterized protein LOC115776718 [Archocentrus centrarchus]
MASTSKSARSLRTSRSSGSAVSAAHARAKAEAAKVRASYATKEAQLKVEKAQSELEKAKIEAKLEVLTLQKEADAAVAEAQVLEEAEAMQEESESKKPSSEEAKLERTSEYVQSQMDLVQSPHPQELLNTPRLQVSSPNTFVTWHPPDDSNLEPQPIICERKLTKDNVAALNMPNQPRDETKFKLEKPNTSLNPICSPFTPRPNIPSSISHPVEPFAQYMARRDLITSGLYQFDDKPENYRAWYSSFTSATGEVQLSPIQELDLMTKWLGKESSDQVKRIRSVHDNSWVAPLPFKEPRQQLPNNRERAITRFLSLKRNLNRKPKMQEQYVAFMGEIFSNGHAEVAPPLKQEEECWYLPTFGVYHPRKPNQIRVVFDSSAQYSGVSLNNVLLTGPDLNNTLLGVLLRFRTESVAIMADIKQMFHCFVVREDHRNFLRFLWHRDNDINKEVIDYRMKVHVFGNSPSPAVAVYGLRRAIRAGAKDYGADTVKFVERHFYVDDGLISVPSPAEAIDLLQRTQASLAESNLRLHKFVSNSQAVMQAFCPEDCAPVIKDLDLSGEETQSQRSLGLIWEITTDTFTYSVADTDKPFTRRGILSAVNSVFDPLGLLAPVTIQGRALLRELSSECSDWDTPLPEDKQSKWEMWRNSLQDLKELHVPRTYTSTSLSQATHKELCLFSDASTMAIGAVAYLKAVQRDGEVEVGFIMGKAKLAPLSKLTIPRLELCAAVLAVEMADLIQDELDLHFDAVHFYTDSKVVLGYICNESKRFYQYVHNRAQRIRQSSKQNNGTTCAQRKTQQTTH